MENTAPIERPSDGHESPAERPPSRLPCPVSRTPTPEGAGETKDNSHWEKNR